MKHAPLHCAQMYRKSSLYTGAAILTQALRLERHKYYPEQSVTSDPVAAKTKAPPKHSQASPRDALFDAAEAIVLTASDVEVNYQRLFELSREWAPRSMVLPKWDMPPVFLDKADNNTVDFMILGNCINFAFTDFATGKKYAAEYNGTVYEGAMGMWAALKGAFERGIPVLDGDYLSKITVKEAEGIFNGKSQIPMLQERVDILREVGTILKDRYCGHFHNLVAAANYRMFDKGGGLVERLVSEFPSFRDSAVHGGIQIAFNKRAQLAAGMLHEKFLGLGQQLFPSYDVRQLTVFADYELPRALRGLGIVTLSSSLQSKIDSGQLIPKGSPEEVEIRAATVYTARLIEDAINSINPQANVNALHIDYLLWSDGRKHKALRHHLTVTTAY